MTDLGTKEKILRAAHTLFGQKGFDSVSIREISKEAGVNVAAVNYHFENKENLFKETIRVCLIDMSGTVASLHQSGETCDTNALALRIYDYFLENAEALKLAFKMFVIDAHIFPEDVHQEDDFIGPPGGKVMYDCILEELPKAKQEDLVWAVRTIMGQIIHTSLISCSQCVNRRAIPSMTPEAVKAQISRVVRVVLNDLRESKD